MTRLRCGLGLLLWSCLVSLGQEPPGAEYRQALKQAEEMRARGDLEGVVRVLLPWAEKQPDKAEVQHALGVAYFQRNDFAGAIRHLSIALKLEPARQQTVENLAMAYYFSNRSADALPLLRQAVAKNPGDTYFGYALAMAHVYAHDWDAAGHMLAQLFDIPPDSPEALVLTSDFLIREKFTAEAEKLLLLALKKRPDLPDINYRLALIALTNGAQPEALLYLKKQVAAYPAHPMAWHYLGYIYTRQGKLDEAVRSLQRSIWLNLRSTESYILIAEAYTQQGKHVEAEQALQRALELAPQNYEAHFLLARIYHKTNRPELAKKEMAIADKLRANEPRP
jgi:tetratricopeptide (TPR) repeat protein